MGRTVPEKRPLNLERAFRFDASRAGIKEVTEHDSMAVSRRDQSVPLIARYP